MKTKKFHKCNTVCPVLSYSPMIVPTADSGTLSTKLSVLHKGKAKIIFLSLNYAEIQIQLWFNCSG
jgi:hypothetical protein